MTATWRECGFDDEGETDISSPLGRPDVSAATGLESSTASTSTMTGSAASRTLVLQDTREFAASTRSRMLMAENRGLFDAAPSLETSRAILALPFPFFVFGTLRVHMSNNYLMGVPADIFASPFSDDHVLRDHEAQRAGRRATTSSTKELLPKYTFWTPSCLPLSACEDLHIVWEPTSAAPGELFYYDDANFAAAVPAIDNLEGFSAESCTSFSYIRALVRVHALPWGDFRRLPVSLGGRRSIVGVSDADPPASPLFGTKSILEVAADDLTSFTFAWAYVNRTFLAQARSTCPALIAWEPTIVRRA